MLLDLAHRVTTLIDDARTDGLEVYADLYPYGVPWFLTRRAFSHAHPGYPLESLEPALPDLEGGMTITRLAEEWGVPPWDALRRLRSRYGDFPVAIHSIDEEVIRHFLVQPFTMIGADAPMPGGPWWGGVDHPRGAGTYPRILGRYVRELGLLTWPEAVHKMSGMAADLYGLEGRGKVRSGYFADIVVFDPDTIRDRATYGNPDRAPEGIHFVLVNGEIAVEEGELLRKPGPNGEAATGVRAGRVLRKQPSTRVSSINSTD